MAEPYQGFDETKRRYPSAEYVEIAVALKGRPASTLLALHGPLLGKINAAEFRGHPAKTLLFIGPKGDDAKGAAALVFAKRPEGWNTDLNPATGRWEEITHAVTGKGPQEEADFAPLGGVIDGSG